MVAIDYAEMAVKIAGSVPGSGSITVTNPPGDPIDVSVIGQTTATPTLTAATTGNGATFDAGSAMANFSMAIVPSAGVSAGVVDLQVSHDGTDWIKISSSAALLAGTNQQLTLSGSAFRYARGVVSTDVVGGTVTATIMAT